MPSNLEFLNVGYNYGTAPLFSNVSVKINSGEINVIVGRSGVGKSTLMEIGAYLVDNYFGDVLWDGTNVKDLSRNEILEERRSMGFVFQQHALISNYTIFENIALPLRYHTDLSDSDVRKRVGDHMEKFGILDLRFMMPDTLSVGQAKLASLARALVMNPSFIFLDEPLSGLDPMTAEIVSDHITEIVNSRDVTILMVSHMVEFIRKFDCNIVYLSRNGAKVKKVNSIVGNGSKVHELEKFLGELDG